jgi:L-alanine-DL-glutamate epimerase-like enolase superfamily enzyme
MLWVQVHTDTGLVGLGETYYVPGAVAAVIHDVAAPLLLGRSAYDLERHWTALFQTTNYYGYAGAEMRAISALDIALWDILGQHCGEPIYNLLGGQVRDRIRIYNTCASYGDQRDYEAFHERPGELAENLLAEGVTAMKIWPFDVFANPRPPGEGRHAAGVAGTGRNVLAHNDGQYISPEDLDTGLDAVRQIRKAVGNRMEIAIELHSMWNLPSAIKIARALEPYDILWFEDALTPDPVDDLARLVQETRVPICTSERLFTRYAFRQVLERKAAHIVMPDIIWTGGISEGKKIATMAEAYHLPIAPHDCVGPITLIASLHLDYAVPNVYVQEVVRAYLHGVYPTLVTWVPTVVGGEIRPPETPGLGTELLPDLLARPGATVRLTRAE